jgi:hypothetical protein
MKWTVKLVAEVQPGTLVEQEVITVEREDLISPATVGLTIAEGKAIMENLQQQIVAAQVQRRRRKYQVLFAMWEGISHEGLLSPIPAD